MTGEVFKTGPFAAFSVHDQFAQAATRETAVVFDIGAIAWPDGLGPAPIALGPERVGPAGDGPAVPARRIAESDQQGAQGAGRSDLRRLRIWIDEQQRVRLLGNRGGQRNRFEPFPGLDPLR